MTKNNCFLRKHLYQFIFIGYFLSNLVSAGAATFFFPDMNASTSYSSGSMDWLRDARDAEGYLTITSEVLPVSSCAPLSSHTFWTTEKNQLVLSVMANGFKNKLDKTEIPIATYDGRENGSECASLSTTPTQILPLTMLRAGEQFNAENLSLVLNVKSSNDTSHDFVGSAKLVLGAAAMVASGGSAAAIGSVSSTVGNSVISQAQSKANDMLKGMIDAKVPIHLSWKMLRNGIKTIEVPVYRSNKGINEASDKKIQELQNDPRSEKTKLFTVRFTFNYTRTIFYPNVGDVSNLVSHQDLSAARILNSKLPKGDLNFIQLLNDTSPSLLQMMASASEKEMTKICSLGLQKLRDEELNNIDIAIIMKSFIDEAKGGTSDWYYNPANVNACFQQLPNVMSYVVKIYGAPTPKFVIGDVQNGLGEAYMNWRDRIGPELIELRRALLAKENRIKVLSQFNHGLDISLNFSSELAPWRHPLEPDNTLTPSGVESDKNALASANIGSPAPANDVAMTPLRTETPSTDAAGTDSNINNTLLAADPSKTPAPSVKSLKDSARPVQPNNPDPLKDKLPALSLIAAQKFKNIACFIYKDDKNLDPSALGAYFIMTFEDKQAELGFVRLSPVPPYSVGSLEAHALTTDWIHYFKTFTYPGGECLKTLSTLE